MNVCSYEHTIICEKLHKVCEHFHKLTGVFICEKFHKDCEKIHKPNCEKIHKDCEKNHKD